MNINRQAVPTVAIVMFWCTEQVTFLVDSVMQCCQNIQKMTRIQDGRAPRSSPFFKTKTNVDIFEGLIMEQRHNQDNLNILLGIQSMLTYMYTCGV
jgi:hypothetical protein